MTDTDTEGRPRRLIRLFTEQPLIVNILSGVAVVLILALIGKASHLIGRIGYAPVLIALGVIALICGLLPLIRYRRSLSTWRFASVVTLVVAGSSLTGVIAGHELPHGLSDSSP